MGDAVSGTLRIKKPTASTYKTMDTGKQARGPV